MKLNRKTVLITGASSGIGEAVARELAAKDCRLILIARRGELLKNLIDSIPNSGDHIYFPYDVSQKRAVENVCQELLDKNIQIDVLLLNAGISGPFDVNNIDLERFLKIYDVNLFSVVNFVKYLVPPMIDRKEGLIAATGSLAGFRGMPKSAPYSSSKAALATFLESLRIDLWPTGVKVTLISPGFVKTPMTDNNKFYMPFMLAAERAAKIIIRGLEKEKTEIHFPYKLSMPAKLGKLLPDKVYAKMMQGRKDYTE